MEVDSEVVDSEELRSRASSAEPSRGQTPRAPGSPEAVQPSPHGVFLSQPASIDEPLLLLDEEAVQAQHEAERVALKEELAEARRSGKADRAALDALTTSLEELKLEREETYRERRRLEKENEVLRLQLQDHHGIMAAEWGQTLQFQERLRQEEAEVEWLSEEVLQHQSRIQQQEEELLSLRKDAFWWRLLAHQSKKLEEVRCEDLDYVLEVAIPGIADLQAESRVRARNARGQLRDELEQQLCAVCRDAKKAVLFLPCQHLCVCEGCRIKLRPYRCPMCQEPIQTHISRVHF